MFSNIEQSQYILQCLYMRSTRSGWSGYGRTTFVIALYKPYEIVQFGRAVILAQVPLWGTKLSH